VVSGLCITPHQRRDDRPPELCPQYHANYYAAFVQTQMGIASKRCATRRKAPEITDYG
jgi:hypothetical protein